MKEHISTPHNPSEAFAQYSEHDSKGRENLLDSEAAAYAAKPWMDVAVDLHGAKNAAAADLLDEGETVYDLEETGGSLNYLTEYAEKRARQAAAGERNDSLTEDEKTMLDVYEAETEMTQAQATFDLDELSTEQVSQAWAMAKDRAKAARQSGNMAEMHKWNKLAVRAEEYDELVFGQTDDEDEYRLKRKLRPDASNAGFVLSMLDNNGGYRQVAGEKNWVAEAKVDAKNMRDTAQLYALFAEVQAQKAEESGQEKSPAAQQEYNPDTTILPENPVARMKFVKEYFADSKHQDFSPDNVKVLQDFLVQQARSEVKYTQKMFPGRTVKGDMSLAFRMSAFSMKELREQSHDQMFAWKLVAHNLKKPDMTYGEFGAMSLKEIASATGIDITKFVDDYDKYVRFIRRAPIEIPETTALK